MKKTAFARGFDKKEDLPRLAFFLAACLSVAAVALICFFMFSNGGSAIAKIGFAEFVFGMRWRPDMEAFGIFPMIAGSLAVTAGAAALGVPLGVVTAVYLARYCPKKLYPPFKRAVELLAGIPSVVYGFVGLTAIVPAIRRFAGGSGSSILAASIVLSIMILPTIAGTSEAAIRAVPPSYYEGSVALGACKERSVFFIELKAARSGIVAGVILGIGRAIGETMAVIMVAGNQAVLPRGLTKGARTLTANIVLEMGYAAGLHRQALIGTAVVLFVFILLVNLVFIIVAKRGR